MDFGKLYFYTATIRHWIPILGQYHLEPIITESMEFLHIRECLKVYGFVIMPNHMHMIMEQVKPNGKETPISSLMKYTSHEFEAFLRKHDSSLLKKFRVKWESRKINFWQTHPDTFELNNEETIFQKLNYIHCNPLQEHWSLVKDSVDYLYSSARFYETGEKNFQFLHDYRDWCPSR